MRTQIVSAREFRQNIFRALDDVVENLTPYILTRNGEPQAVVFSMTELEALLETHDILDDPVLMRQIAAYQRNRLKGSVPWKTLRRPKDRA